MILIISAFNNKSEAAKIGKALLSEKLIACYNLFPIESGYLWKGKIVDDKEILMILKTKDKNFSKIESFIIKHHSYEVPEIVAVKATFVSKPYLNWLNSEITN
mgnify:CR=1 FL=1